MTGAAGRTRPARPRLSPLSLGAAGLAGLYAEVAEADGQATVRRALELGVSYLDTAPHYGAGLSEQRVGRALAGVDRDRFVLSTKVGRLLRPAADPVPAARYDFAVPTALDRVWDFSADGIRRSLEESLDRLGLDRVDVVYLHDPDDFEAQVYAEAYPALAGLREQGVVRAIGAGMNTTAMLTRFVERLDLDLVLIAGRYTLLDHGALAELLPACERRGTGVVAAAVFNSGLLADPHRTPYFDYRTAPPDLADRAIRMERICARHGVSLVSTALRFPLGHPAVVSVLNGARSVAEIEQNAAAFEAGVPAAVWDELRAEALLPPDVPVPP